MTVKNELDKLNYDKLVLSEEEIDNLNEYSKLFQGYIQMDSYILLNYKLSYCY